ncbi:cellulose biosynthesis cyclic di-GMP-binding regulatory protein BcsB [Aeromonas simiae]|uniref:Cyclic di-GMP-binding protein n=1 Tax=Aeromonas simiae TaxID=218936 RepID=A0A5J6X2S1_9GAMM|nr:cellulose biosynthesis cyclic di-GMP-binding regulatory protein BcsB [Aeromonas simiae]QFI56075.1 cellulose biosynthesis cyclic di-GMP-binding regulatory protein BcsB [Aeromonas simiae]
MMKLQRYLIPSLLMTQCAVAAESQPTVSETGPLPPFPAPIRTQTLTLEQLAAAPGTLSLRGVSPEGLADFTVRRDEVVTSAALAVDYTPSPSLQPLISQLKVYFNDELMGVTAFQQEQMGQRSHADFDLDPRYAKDFNRLRFNFIGHYPASCENPASETLWLNVNRDTKLTLQLQTLPVRNELSFFPMPFLDTQDHGKLELPMVFAGQPSLTEQKAAAVLASWFGVQAQWRGQHFPVAFNQVPERNSVVFATNESRPAFLGDYPKVKGPTIDMISTPDNPYVKLLLVLGRDDEDLLTATRALAQGNVLLRGQSVLVEEFKPLAPRQPYDAPNWVRLDRPVRFGELIDYPNQLQAAGRNLWPLSLTLRLPPDLYIIGSQGLRLDLKYHYTSPTTRDGSRLDVSINDQFMKSYSLPPDDIQGEQLISLPLWLFGDGDERVLRMPGLKTGQPNRLGFSFEYAQQFLGGSSGGSCSMTMPTGQQVRIDDNSTIDVTGYRHFLEMPNLRAFTGSGFPFSRLADLSETQVVMPAKPLPGQITTLLDTVGAIGAETGYPTLALQLADDWAKVRDADLDTLLIGTLPTEFRGDAEPDALLEMTRSWVNQPMQPLGNEFQRSLDDRKAEARVGMRGNTAIAAILGVQSPSHEQRSVVALLADSDSGVKLLNEAMQTPALRDQVAGSVAIVRESGVTSLDVGERYEVGNLPWWEKLWHRFANHPVYLAMVALISMLLLGWGLRVLLAGISRRRLKEE